MPLYLILALFWLIGALVMFFYPTAGRLELGNPFAWFAVLLCCYNLVCWWLRRSQWRRREEAKQVPERQREKGYHPEFDFEEKE